MTGNKPIKSMQGWQRLRCKSAVRRHGDHTTQCMVWRKNRKTGKVMLTAFRGTPKYQRIHTRATEERVSEAVPFIFTDPMRSEVGVYHSDLDEDICIGFSQVEEVPHLLAGLTR